MDYHKKYLKYKNKYISMKHGGDGVFVESEEFTFVKYVIDRVGSFLTGTSGKGRHIELNDMSHNTYKLYFNLDLQNFVNETKLVSGKKLIIKKFTKSANEIALDRDSSIEIDGKEYTHRYIFLSAKDPYYDESAYDSMMYYDSHKKISAPAPAPAPPPAPAHYRYVAPLPDGRTPEGDTFTVVRTVPGLMDSIRVEDYYTFKRDSDGMTSLTRKTFMPPSMPTLNIGDKINFIEYEFLPGGLSSILYKRILYKGVIYEEPTDKYSIFTPPARPAPSSGSAVPWASSLTGSTAPWASSGASSGRAIPPPPPPSASALLGSVAPLLGSTPPSQPSKLLKSSGDVFIGWRFSNSFKAYQYFIKRQSGDYEICNEHGLCQIVGKDTFESLISTGQANKY